MRTPLVGVTGSTSVIVCGAPVFREAFEGGVPLGESLGALKVRRGIARRLAEPAPGVALVRAQTVKPAFLSRVSDRTADRSSRWPGVAMATDANSSVDALTPAADKDPAPKSALSELLTRWDDHQLFQLGKFYRDRLTEAIEGGVGKLSLMLREEGHLSADEHEIIYQLAERGNRTDSSKLFLGLVTGKLMWESFVKVRDGLPKLDGILEEIQEFGLGVHEYMKVARGLSESPTELRDVQQRHRETLRAQTEALRVPTMQTREKVQAFPLLDRYAEVTVVSTTRPRRVGEREQPARGQDEDERREMGLQTELEEIRTDQLFRSASSPGSSAAVAGVPGVGKTTMVQKIINDWATGKIYQQFQFVFSFKFRDLNNLNCRINLRELIQDQHPYFGNILGEVWKDPEKLFFIFDGLDEFKDKIDFADGRGDREAQHECTDPEFRCKVSDIVYSLIQRKLLPGCSVLVTTRPTALHLLEKADIGVWAKIRGLVGEKRMEFFSRYFEDQAVAADVFKYLEGYEILNSMSDNPTYCLILALTLGPYFTLKARDPQQLLRIVTQLHSYYLYNILTNHGHELRSPYDLLLRIGQAAFTGASGSSVIFTEGDVIKCKWPPSQFLSGVDAEREDSARSMVYTFPYLSVHEFIGALAHFLTPDPGDILNLLAGAHGREGGRFEMLLCFAASLGATGSAWVLAEFLGPLPHRTASRVVDWVREEVERQVRDSWGEAGKKRLLNTLSYLSESRDRGLAQAALGSVEALSFRGLRLTPTDCAVLSYAIGFCDTVKRLDLKGCYIESQRLQQLGPGLHKCQELRLGFNFLGDSAGKVVSAALRVPGCQIQSLWLNHSGLEDPDVDHLASALRTNSSLVELDVRGNRLGDSGVRLLAAALRDPNCKLQILGLWDVGLTDSGAEDLASALSRNRSLTELGLGSNDLGDSGLRLLSAALRDSDSKLQKLDLTRLQLTGSAAEDLASALRTNRSLRELDLSYNTLGDSGVTFLAEALRDPECKLQSLGLTCDDLTAACAEDLASAVGANASLVELKLGVNELGDAGVRLLTAALMKRDCSHQRLRLDENGLTGSCVEDLAAALGAGSTLTGLDLSYNQLGDLGVKQLSKALKGPDCKLEKLRLRGVGLTTPYVRYLASAVKANHSLVELDLGRNKLGDSGVKQLSAALRKAGCRLQKLSLYAAELTDSCTDELVAALSVNRSVKQLNLGSNSFTDLSVPALCRLVQSRENLERIKLRENQFSAEGQSQLLSLQGIRSGLRVELQRNYDP